MPLLLLLLALCHRHAEADAEEARDDIAEHELDRANPDVGPQLAARGERIDRRDDLGRGCQEQHLDVRETVRAACAAERLGLRSLDNNIITSSSPGRVETIGVYSY